MSHHGQDLTQISEHFKELFEHQKRLRGTYPEGKLNEQDKGALSFTVSTMGEKVIIAFGEPTAWMGMTGDQAAELGVLLIKRARQAGLTKPFSIEL